MPRGKMIFIVEGDLERIFLQRQCGNKLIIRKIPCNGDSVSIERIAIMVKSILAIIRNPGDVFVVIDREGRSETAEEIEQLILGQLNGIVAGVLFSIHIADRMTENWILAEGNALLSENLEVDEMHGGYEGCGGKAKLKTAFKKLNSTYSETVDGVRLLEKCIPSVIAGNSPSFFRLYHQLINKLDSCAWVTKTN